MSNAKNIIEAMKTKKKRRIAIKRMNVLGVIMVTMVIISVTRTQPYASATQNEVQIQQTVINEETFKSVTALAVAINEPVIEVTSQASPAQKDESIYRSGIPMPKEHQEYLYRLCKERELDYKTMLAIIKHESQFDVNCISDRDYGYFQINKCNHVELSKDLKTDNDALDPYVNINWGTYMMSNIYKKWSNKGYTGNDLDEVVWSEYNEGYSGLKKWGLAYKYINKVNAEKKFIINNL